VRIPVFYIYTECVDEKKKRRIPLMRYLLLISVILASATASLAQDIVEDYSNWEFYGGYAYERGNNGADRLNRDARITTATTSPIIKLVRQDVNFNGFSAEVVYNVSRHVGIVANFSAGFRNHVRYFDNAGGRFFDARLRRWNYFVGPRFNWRNDSPLIPFGEALFGVSRFDARFNNLTSSASTETAFSMALGGGLDIRAGKHIDLRAGQIDYMPTFFKHQREDGFRVSAGIKIKTAPDP
jgi:opacity protein-like surface antigen